MVVVEPEIIKKKSFESKLHWLIVLEQVMVVPVEVDELRLINQITMRFSYENNSLRIIIGPGGGGVGGCK